MKKGICFLLLFMFIIGLISIAAQQEAKDARVKIRERIKDKNSLEKVDKLSRATQKELENLTETEIKARLNRVSIKRVKISEDLGLRKIPAEKRDLAIKRYINSKQNYLSSKEEFLNSKQRFKQFKDGKNEKEMTAEAKKVLIQSADRIISHLEKIKSQIESNENIEENKANAFIQDIDAKINEIGSIKPEIESAVTKEEIKDIAKKLKLKWANFNHKAGIYSERAVTARVEGVLNRAQILEKRLDIALAKIKEKGIEVDVEKESLQFSTLLKEAKQKINQAKEKLESARKTTNKESAKSIVDEAKGLIKQSRETLKKAHDVLKEIAGKIRGSGGELEIDKAEVEVEG